MGVIADKIRRAIFGGEVRDSIADGIEVVEQLREDYDNQVINAGNSNAEIVDARGGQTKLKDRLDNFDEQLEHKASKNEANSLQQQINNLVLGAVGDGNNAEVVQARGQYNTLNDRLSTEERIRESNLASLTNKEISDCFNFNSNMWISGDVSVEYKSGNTWKYKDIPISGFEIGEEYVIGLTTAINHVNPNYIIELVGHSYKIINTNETYKFIPKTETITVRFQAVAGEQSTSDGVAVYSGIYIRKGNLSLKDSAIKRKYDISEIERISDVLEFPVHIITDATFTKTGGTGSYNKYEVNHEVKENTVYTFGYEELTGNRLSVGNPTVIYICFDSKGETTQPNTNILFVGSDKKATITTPPGTSRLQLNFMVTMDTSFDEEFTVTWEGVYLYEGNKDNITIKEEALPTIPVPTKDLFELYLPKDIYVAIGYPLEIYNHTLCRCINIENYVFEWKLPKGGGKAFKDKILLEPNDNLNGITDILTLNIYDTEYNLLDTQTSNIHYIKPDDSLAPSSARKVLCIGDSLTDISVWREELYTRFNDDIATNKIEYLGTLGKFPYFNEGHSGWSLTSYLTDSSEGWNGNYKIKVSSMPNISPKKQYKFGGKIFEYEKIENENGDIWVYFNRISGGGFVSTSDSPCKEVDSAISGDSSISFTDCEVTSLNPFYNNGFDCKHYSDTYLNGAVPNDVFIWLGTNGGTPSMNLESVKNKVLSEMNKYKTIIDNIRNNWVDTKIFISYLHYRPDQNGQGYTSGVASTKAWDNYVFEFNTQLYDTFKDYPNIIFVPVGQTFDRVNNYPAKEININTRNSKKTIVAGDTVHMARDTGFLQVSDAIYGAYVNNI